MCYVSAPVGQDFVKNNIPELILQKNINIGLALKVGIGEKM